MRCLLMVVTSIDSRIEDLAGLIRLAVPPILLPTALLRHQVEIDNERTKTPTQVRELDNSIAGCLVESS
jgi:hypothetical protein